MKEQRVYSFDQPVTARPPAPRTVLSEAFERAAERVAAEIHPSEPRLMRAGERISAA